MSSLKVPYTRVSTNFNLSMFKFKNQPLLKVGLLGQNNQCIRATAYIDTGAQVCLFNKDYATFLGIKNYKDTEESIPLTGIGGKKPENVAYFHSLTLVVFKNQKKLEIKNAYKIQTKIGFLEKEIGFAGILGVYGFLDQFSFLANIPEHYFELTPKFVA